MDAVCIKGGWDVIIANDPDGNPEGIMVYHYRSYKGFKLILMPPLTFYNGIYLFYKKDIKYHSKISFENKLYAKLVDQLPKHDLYYQQFSPQMNNWFSLYQKGFKQTTRYTYTIDTTIGEKCLWENLKGNVRRNIKKAEQQCVIVETDFIEFWNALELAFKSRSERNPFNKPVLSNLYKNFKSSDQIKVSLCKHKTSGIALAGTIIMKDQNKSYYVCGFYNSQSKQLGALSYLLWNNIETANTPKFDFEGSMLKDIEYFFRAFGGHFTPHYRIWKINSPILKLITQFKKLPFLQ